MDNPTLKSEQHEPSSLKHNGPHDFGPWTYEKGHYNREEARANSPGSITSKEGWYIATIENAPHAEANARLIAAAPDMLAALQALLAWAETQPTRYAEDLLQIAAHNAIAKATGGK